MDSANRKTAIDPSETSRSLVSGRWVKLVQGLKADEAREHAESDAKRKPKPAPGVDLTKLDLAAYVGTFKDPWRGEATITKSSDGLTLTFSHTKELTGLLTPIRPGLFVVRWKSRVINADAYVRFREDFAGAVEGFTMELSRRTQTSASTSRTSTSKRS